MERLRGLGFVLNSCIRYGAEQVERCTFFSLEILYSLGHPLNFSWGHTVGGVLLTTPPSYNQKRRNWGCALLTLVSIQK